MATLATMLNRILAAKGAEQAAAQATARQADIYTLRPLANEDVYFYVKRIDNTRVVREADPSARGACWKLIATACVGVLLVIGVLLPSAYGLLAGYQIQALKAEQKHLESEQAALELDEAKLVSPQRLEELAAEQQFVTPAPQKVFYLDSTNKDSVALNVGAK